MITAERLRDLIKEHKAKIYDITFGSIRVIPTEFIMVGGEAEKTLILMANKLFEDKESAEKELYQ